MKRQIASAILFGLFIATAGFGALTDVIYRATEVGDGRWGYTYDVNDISLPVPVERSPVWFDLSLYHNDNFAAETSGPSNSECEQMVWHLESVLTYDEPDDPNASTRGTQKRPAKRGGGFAVSSDRVGQGKLAAQFDETIEPQAFEATDPAWIIPEPATLFLLGLGALGLRRKQKSSQIWNVEIGNQH